MEPFSVIGQLSKVKREIEYYEAIDRIVWALGDLDLDSLSHRQLVRRIVSLNNQAMKASKAYRGF